MGGITIDGRLDDWPKGLTRYPIRNRLVGWSGYDPRDEEGDDRDPEAHFMVGYDREAGLIYFAVVVEDDEAPVATFKDAHHTDAVEIYLDAALSDRKIPATMGLDAATMPVLQYAAVPGRGAAYGDPKGANPSLVYGNIGRTRTTMRYRIDGATTTYEWEVEAFDRYPGRPARLEPGKRLGLELAVVDKDRTPDRPLPSFLTWGAPPGEFKGRDAGSLGELILGGGP
jgi:hypothetical protein